MRVHRKLRLNEISRDGSALGIGILLLLGTIFAVAGYCMAEYWGKPTLKQAKESVNWPTTMGVIEESQVKTHRGDDSTTYSPYVLFRYEVDGQEIRSDMVYMGANFSSNNRSAHQKVVTKYPVGAEVKVYYKPDDPFIAILEPGTTYMGYFPLVLSYIFLGSGTLLLGIASAIFVFGKKTLVEDDFQT